MKYSFLSLIHLKNYFEQDETRPNPQSVMMNDALLGNDNPKLPFREFIEEKIITPNDFKRLHTRVQIQAGEIQYIPGLSMEAIKTVRLNNTHYPPKTIAEYKRRQARMHKKDPQLFTEIAIKYGYKHANTAMELDNPKYIPTED